MVGRFGAVISLFNVEIFQELFEPVGLHVLASVSASQACGVDEAVVGEGGCW